MQLISGQVNERTRHGVLVAVTWAANQVAVTRGGLCEWLGRRSTQGRVTGTENGSGQRRGSRRLWSANEHLAVCLSHIWKSKSGSSLTAAVAVSLVCLASGRRPRDDVAVSADMDLRGNLCDVAGLPGKLQGCKYFDIRLMLVPESSIEKYRSRGEEAALPRDLKAYASKVLRGVKSMIDIIHLATVDCPPPPLPLSTSGLPTKAVGVGLGIMYQARINLDGSPSSEPWLVEVSYVPAGKVAGAHQVYITGYGGENMKPMVTTAIQWIHVQSRAIAKTLGLREGWEARLRTHQVHVHFPNGYEKMNLVHYTAVIAVALVCCLTGRRQRRDTTLSGEVNLTDVVQPLPDSIQNADHVARVREQGFRRLVLGGFYSVRSEALVQLLGQEPAVELIYLQVESEYRLVDLLPRILEPEVGATDDAEEHFGEEGEGKEG